MCINLSFIFYIRKKKRRWTVNTTWKLKTQNRKKKKKNPSRRCKTNKHIPFIDWKITDDTHSPTKNAAFHCRYQKKKALLRGRKKTQVGKQRKNGNFLIIKKCGSWYLIEPDFMLWWCITHDRSSASPNYFNPSSIAQRIQFSMIISVPSEEKISFWGDFQWPALVFWLIPVSCGIPISSFLLSTLKFNIFIFL